MNIGKTIRRLREQRHLKQEDIAEKLNMSVTGYGKIERDEVRVNHERLEEIAKIFDVPLVDLITENQQQNGFSTVQQNTNAPNNNGIFYSSEKERELYEKLLAEKDKRIAILEKLLAVYEADDKK